MITRMPIPSVLFSSFLTQRFHYHFVKVRYTIGGPIRKNMVCFCSLLCFLPYSSNPPYLCFPFLGRWYTYNRSRIICGSCVFTIVGRIINIRAFNVTSEVCNLVSSWVGPLYITSSWLFYTQFGFSYFGRIGGMHIICWIVCGQGPPWGSWDDI
jgi:hypothetical protein